MSYRDFGALWLVFSVTALGHGDSQSSFGWMKPDRFDHIDHIYRSVTATNCRSKGKDQLKMRPDVVSQLPVYNQLLSKVWYRNRTSLIHLHNMALNRAFFYSYLSQRLNTSQTFHCQPTWLYFYLSQAADVNANPETLNGSALYFDINCHYPNWFTTVPFNRTLPLFGPKSYRWDDYQDSDNWIREPTRRVVRVVDAGAGHSRNYTHPEFKMNPWYKSWLPDLLASWDSMTKFTYHLGIRSSNVTGHFTQDNFENFAFFGPASPGAEDRDPRRLPVQWTAPYFDCGGSNKWVVSAVSPVVDFMPRYSPYVHMRRPRIVAVVVLDTDFVSLDFNPCAVGPGNPGPSYLSGIHRCKSSTLCKHVSGYGFRRGGYNCFCRSGMRGPWHTEQPYLGQDIELATAREYQDGFSCTPSNFQQVLPVIHSLQGQALDEDDIHNIDPVNNVRRRSADFKTSTKDGSKNKASSVDFTVEISYQKDVERHIQLKKKLRSAMNATTSSRLSESVRQVRDRHIHRYLASGRAKRIMRRRRTVLYDQQSIDRMSRIFEKISRVTTINCAQLANHELRLPGDVSYGVWGQFENEGRTALRLSHFLSAYLQNVMIKENFGNLKGGGPLHFEAMYGEVTANVMANHRILSAGLFFDRYKFHNSDGTARELFGPWAFRGKGLVQLLDQAGLTSQYVDQDWFQTAKARFSVNFENIEQYKIRAHVRSDPNGTSSVRHEYYPMTYRAASYQQGFWTSPYFRCDQRVDAWVMTYVSPFFGLDPSRRKLEFKGVTTADVPLSLLEINQCAQDFTAANAFKNTARCDYLSTKCAPISGFPLMRGSYRCTCRLGFEYWHADGKFWIEGSLLELEFDKKQSGVFSRFDLLNCRPSEATKIIFHVGYTCLWLIVFVFLHDDI